MLRLSFLSLVCKIFLTMPGPNGLALPRFIRTRQKHELAIFSTVGVLNEMSHEATNLIHVLGRAALAINFVFSK